LGLNLLSLAHTSISVPSTVKCSSDRAGGPSLGENAFEERWATYPSSNRWRFFVNTVASRTGSSMFRPTNQRKSRL
jgi:hypothetical protein